MQQRLKSNEDVYAFARELAERARALGDESTASILEDALQAGFTASELLGELQHALLVVKDRINDRYPPKTGELVDEAIEGIRQAFKKANRGF